MMNILKNMDFSFLVPPAKAGGNLNRGFLFKDKLLFASYIELIALILFLNIKSNNVPEAELPPFLNGEIE